MTKKTYRILWVTILSAISIAAIVFLLPEVILLFLPFVLAWLLAKLIEPAVSFLNTRLHLPRTIASVVGIITAVGILGALLTFVFGRIWKEANDIITHADVIAQNFTTRYQTFRDTFATRFGFADILDKVFAGSGESLANSIAENAVPALQGVYEMIKSVPTWVIFFVVLFISTYFISSDKERISAGIRKVVPEKIMRFTDICTENMFSALGAYIKAQLVLICVTFLELTIGFLIIGGAVADYTLLLAIIISIVDAIPILGTGTVLVPWGIYSLIVGDIRLGAMLLILYLICLAVRQILEPRLMAHQIGMHPLLTLMVMYSGFRLFGLFGMILGPIVALFIKQMYVAGIFKRIGAYINE